MYVHKNQGTCSRAIELEIVDGVITHCRFDGGCKGNTEGLARMVIGRKAGTALSGRAGVLGGFILIFIGVEIFITSFF